MFNKSPWSRSGTVHQCVWLIDASFLTNRQKKKKVSVIPTEKYEFLDRTEKISMVLKLEIHHIFKVTCSVDAFHLLPFRNTLSSLKTYFGIWIAQCRHVKPVKTAARFDFDSVIVDMFFFHLFIISSEIISVCVPRFHAASETIRVCARAQSFDFISCGFSKFVRRRVILLWKIQEESERCFHSEIQSTCTFFNVHFMKCSCCSMWCYYTRCDVGLAWDTQQCVSYLIFYFIFKSFFITLAVIEQDVNCSSVVTHVNIWNSSEF